MKIFVKRSGISKSPFSVLYLGIKKVLYLGIKKVWNKYNGFINNDVFLYFNIERTQDPRKERMFSIGIIWFFSSIRYILSTNAY
jgi:hypothetical protein